MDPDAVPDDHLTQYEMTYRATHDAIWSVIGVLAMALFYSLAGLLGLWLAGIGIMAYSEGTANAVTLAFAVLGLGMGLAAVYRLARVAS